MIAVNHEEYMKMALALARKAEQANEVPIGAVIVKNGKVIAKGYNKREKTHDATAHAEVVAIRKACRKLRDFRLTECTMYVTMEPCTMCMGAILNSRIDTVVFGGAQDKTNILSSREINERAELNHKVKIVSGVLADESSAIVTNYFKSKRRRRW